VKNANSEVLLFFFLICQVIFIEFIYQNVVESIILGLKSSEQTKDRSEYSFWIVIGLSISLMLLGLVYSFKRVFDPLIMEEKMKKNQVSGEMFTQVELLINKDSSGNNDDEN
jgi:TRAP-type mannitol/chloroaromatic compound transport system permease small subunit